MVPKFKFPSAGLKNTRLLAATVEVVEDKLSEVPVSTVIPLLLFSVIAPDQMFWPATLWSNPPPCMVALAANVRVLAAIFKLLPFSAPNSSVAPAGIVNAELPVPSAVLLAIRIVPVLPAA